MQGVVSTNHLICLVQAFSRLGIEPEKAIENLGLLRYGKDLSQFPDVVSIAEFIKACERANICTSDSLFTLKAGMAQSSSDFSPLAQLVCYSDNLEDALDRYVEYVGYFNSGFSVACLPKPQELIYPVYNTDIDPQECSAFMELRIATCIRLIRLITGEQTPDIIAEVGFQHSANAEACKYEEILQSPVFFEHEYSHFSVKRPMLNRPVLSRNKILLQHTLDNVRARITADNSSSNDIIIRVRSLIRSGLERKQFSQRDIAEKMDMSTSTLKRLLDAFNVNFQFLLDQERRYVAEQLLQRGEVFMEDIAIKTGYSSSAAFTRGYTRITGITPNQYRWNTN